MMAMISLILIIRWCKILKAVVNFILYVLRVLNCFIVSANLEIWSTSVKYYNSLMMMIVRWHCRNVKFSLFSLSMQRFINTNRESRNSTTWPRWCFILNLTKEHLDFRKLEPICADLIYLQFLTIFSCAGMISFHPTDDYDYDHGYHYYYYYYYHYHFQELISSYPTDDTAKVKKIAESINQRWETIYNWLEWQLHSGKMKTNNIESSRNRSQN